MGVWYRMFGIWKSTYRKGVEWGSPVGSPHCFMVPKHRFLLLSLRLGPFKSTTNLVKGYWIFTLWWLSVHQHVVCIDLNSPCIIRVSEILMLKHNSYFYRSWFVHIYSYMCEPLGGIVYWKLKGNYATFSFTLVEPYPNHCDVWADCCEWNFLWKIWLEKFEQAHSFCLFS